MSLLGTHLLSTGAAVIIGLISSWFSDRYSLPGGRIFLTVFIVGAANLAGAGFVIPTWVQLPAALVVGTMFGLRLKRDRLRQITRVIPAAVAVIAWYVGITWVYAWVLRQVAQLEPATALVSVLPGGITEASLIASGFGADQAIVATFQMARFIAVITVIPILGGPLRRFLKPHGAQPTDPDHQSKSEGPRTHDRHTLAWVPPLLASAAIAFPLVVIGFPAGALLGPLIFFGTFNATGVWRPPAPPQWLYKAAQVAVGSVVGSSFTREHIMQFSRLLVPTLVLALLVIVTSFLLGTILAKAYKWPTITGFLAVVPGGLTPVAIMAADLGLDVAVISVLQLVRILTAILVIPTTYSWFF